MNTMTNLLVAPGTAWLRKALTPFSLPMPFEKPVREGLNCLRISAYRKHKEGCGIYVIRHNDALMSINVHFKLFYYKNKRARQTYLAR